MPILDDATARWAPDITLDGADVSARLTGEIRVLKEEDAAGASDFRMLPPAGAIDPTAWVGAPAVVEFVRLDAAGAETGRWTLFTGRVNRPTYDPDDASATFEATDGLQEVVDGMTRAALDTLIGGEWSEDVFRDTEAGNWEYAQQRLETVPASLELDGAGAARVTAWAAGAVDLTVTQGDLVGDEPVVLELAPRDGLVNAVALEVDYRFERIRHRETSWSWNYGRAFCDYLEQSTTLPTIDMARSAAEDTDWLIRGEQYDRLPVTGVYSCGSPPANVAWVNEIPDIITRAAYDFVTRWTQTITEQYRLTVSAPESSGAVGAISVESRAAVDVAFDWAAYEDAQNPDTAADGCGAAAADKDTITLFGTTGGVETLEGAADRYAEPAGSTTDAWGDYVLDQADEARRTAAVETDLARARVRVLESHRANRVAFTTVLRPDIDLTSTVRLNTARLQATGKVVAVEHRLDIATGRHSSRITIAVSRRYGTGTAPAEDALTAPARPDTTPTVASSQPFNTAGTATQLGGITGAPVHDPCKDGYSGNYMAVPALSVVSGTDADGDSVFVPPIEASAYLDDTAEIHPTQFRVTLDAVEAAVRDPYAAEATASYTVAIPDDELVMAAP